MQLPPLRDNSAVTVAAVAPAGTWSNTHLARTVKRSSGLFLVGRLGVDVAPDQLPIMFGHGDARRYHRPDFDAGEPAEPPPCRTSDVAWRRVDLRMTLEVHLQHHCPTSLSDGEYRFRFVTAAGRSGVNSALAGVAAMLTEELSTSRRNWRRDEQRGGAAHTISCLRPGGCTLELSTTCRRPSGEQRNGVWVSLVTVVAGRNAR